MTTPHPQVSFPFASDDEEEDCCSVVLSVLDKQQLCLHAASLHQRLYGTLSTPLIGDAMHGSYNICLPLTFNNGFRWIARFPFSGIKGRWNELCAAALESEAKTMTFLKLETTVPLPEVLDFCTTLENPLGCPFIIMTFISGLLLGDAWFQEDADAEVVHRSRTRALEGIASAMAQLSRFTFPTGGSPVFKNDGTIDPSQTRSLRLYDQLALLEGAGEDMVYKECPAYSNPKHYYTFMLDKHPTTNEYVMGRQALLRQLISWIPEPVAKGENAFVLAHPDLDMQNIIVNEAGEVQGIIDWDGVAAMPLSCGNERYPLWLTNEWDDYERPHLADKNKDEDDKEKRDDRAKSNAQYRAIYRDLLRKATNSVQQQNKTKRKRRSRDRAIRAASKNICRASFIASNLAIAVSTPLLEHEILANLVHEAWAVEGREGNEPWMSDLCAIALGKEKNPAVMQTLRSGFLKLLYKD
ncbi:hypothetical protein BJX64DRAFT_249438 [Aspergillus heterothallicus]